VVTNQTVYVVDCYIPDIGWTKCSHGLTANTNAIYAFKSSSAVITLNTIKFNDYGVVSYQAAPTITFNSLIKNKYGIHIYKHGGDYPNINNNTIDDHLYYGIILDRTTIQQDDPVSTNNITNNYGGIYVYSNETDDSNVCIGGNELWDNYIGALFVNSTSKYTQVINNDFYNNNYSIYLQKSSPKILINTIIESSMAGIYINEDSSSEMSGNTIDGAETSQFGICVLNSTISDPTKVPKAIGNTINNNTYGIYVYNSNTRIGKIGETENNISNNEMYGVYLHFWAYPAPTSLFSNITNNVIWTNGQAGIVLKNHLAIVVYAEISSNQIHIVDSGTTNRPGICTHNSCGGGIGNSNSVIKLEDNNITDHSSAGYVIGICSEYSYISNNTISGASIGIKAYNSKDIIGNNLTSNGDGIYIRSTSHIQIIYNNLTSNIRGLNISLTLPARSHNNSIHHNNFFSNTQYQAMDFGINNWWNDSSIGNHWSDYNETSEGCVDNDSPPDWICDDPRPIYPNDDDTAEPKDNFPKMKPA
jgi:nitrous oxidase accessory protein NosD